MQRPSQLVRAIVGRATVAIALIAVAGPAYAESAVSPEAFASQFVAAINSGDRGRIEALIDRQSLACLSGEGEPLLAYTIGNWIKQPIPPQYKTQFDEIGADATLVMDVFMPGRFDYPVRPTRKAQISFELSSSNFYQLIAEIGLEAGAWKIVLACPKAGTMAWMLQARAEDEAKTRERDKAVDALVKDMSADYRAELLAMAKAGHWIDAVHKIEKDRQVDTTTAVQTMEKLAPFDSAPPTKP